MPVRIRHRRGGQGSYGHYQQDANTFASWGFDAVKVDFCGGAEYGLNPAVAYSAFHAAIEANPSHRPMLLSICDFLQPEQYTEGRPQLDESAFSSYSFGPSVGNSWRTDTDVGLPGNVPFTDVLRNMDADAAAPQAAGPGHWKGTLLSSSGNRQVWVKPLIDDRSGIGQRAVALLNRGSSATRIETSATAVGLSPAPSYALRNVWTHTTNSTRSSISTEVPGDSTVLLRVSAR
jgi:alpha-galactosidase